MRLLGTHTFIWYVLNIQRLTTQVQNLVDDEDNEILLSTASIWEMAIKQSVGKLSFILPFELFITQ